MSRFFIRFIYAVAVAAILVPDAPVQAQSSGISKAWVVGDAVGYGLLGGTVGFFGGIAVTPGNGWDTLGSAVFGSAIGILTGAMGGAAIAVSAADRRRNGLDLSPVHRTAMTAGMILGGAATGAILSSVLISPSGSGTSVGSDESTSTLFMLAGAAGGGFLASRLSSQLTSHRVSLSPIAGSSGYGMRAGFAF
jgi:hypothetical protein